ncbi:MAG: hypothetical protein AABN95_10495 [Acidobacteriota bacterium]
MSTATDQDCNCRNLLADQETWEIILEPAFCDDPGAADCLAHLLFVLKKSISSGPEGSLRVINTLQDGIRMVWLYTEEHKLARELYETYLSGDLKPWDEPRQLLKGALERFKVKRRARPLRVQAREAEGEKTARRKQDRNDSSS